jgi:hypothetical protein
MLGLEALDVSVVTLWDKWPSSGVGKSWVMRNLWVVEHRPVSPATPDGHRQFVLLARNLLTGALATAWGSGSCAKSKRPPFVALVLPHRESQFLSSGGFHMAAGPKVWTEERITDRFAEGRGQGGGENYIPWVWVQEFSSNANQTRIPSARLKRTIHTFSYLERAMHLWHEYSGYLDYREQFPMDRRITLGAAKHLGVRHPTYPTSRAPTVMMLDTIVFKRDDNGKAVVEAWDAKPKEKLANTRIRDKLLLHKAFCAYIGIEHSTFTESTLPRQMVDSIEWARGGLPVEGEALPYPRFLEVESRRLLQWLRTKHHKGAVDVLCAAWDEINDFERGTSLRLFKLLLWSKQVYVPLDQSEVWRAQLPDQRFYMYQEDRYGAVLH